MDIETEVSASMMSLTTATTSPSSDCGKCVSVENLAVFQIIGICESAELQCRVRVHDGSLLRQ